MWRYVHNAVLHGVLLLIPRPGWRNGRGAMQAKRVHSFSPDIPMSAPAQVSRKRLAETLMEVLVQAAGEEHFPRNIISDGCLSAYEDACALLIEMDLAVDEGRGRFALIWEGLDDIDD